MQMLLLSSLVHCTREPRYKQRNLEVQVFEVKSISNPSCFALPTLGPIWHALLQEEYSNIDQLQL